MIHSVSMVFKLVLSIQIMRSLYAHYLIPASIIYVPDGFRASFINILQAEAEKLSGFTPSIIQPEAAGRGLYARCKTR